MNPIRMDFTPLTDLIPLTDSAPAALESGRSAAPEDFPDPQALLAMLLALAPGGPVPPDLHLAAAAESEGSGVPMPPAPPIAQAGIIVTPDGVTLIRALTPSPSSTQQPTGRLPSPSDPPPAPGEAPKAVRSGDLPPAAGSRAPMDTPPAPLQAGSEGPHPQPAADPAQAPTDGASTSWLRPSKPARAVPADPRDARIEPMAQRTDVSHPVTESPAALRQPEPGLPSAEGRRPRRSAPTEARHPVAEASPALPRPEPSRPSADDRGGLESRVSQLSPAVRAWSPDEIYPPETPMPASPEMAPTLFDQLVRTARILRQEGRTEMHVRLEPPALGWVRVSVRESGDALALHIDAERPETRALLSQALPDLQHALASRGLEMASVAIRLDLDVARTRSGPERAAERPRRQEPRERAPARAEAPRTSALPHVDLTV